MNSSSPAQSYPNLKINGLLSRLKDNLFYIIFLLFFCWFAYQVHMDGLNHKADKFISLSEAWENLTSNQYMQNMVNACAIAKNHNSV